MNVTSNSLSELELAGKIKVTFTECPKVNLMKKLKVNVKRLSSEEIESIIQKVNSFAICKYCSNSS